jgi:hypothetical protein
MVMAASSLPPTRYWVDVILTTAWHAKRSTVNPTHSLMRRCIPVFPTLKRWSPTPTLLKAGRSSSIGAKQKRSSEDERSTAIQPTRGGANDPARRQQAQTHSPRRERCSYPDRVAKREAREAVKRKLRAEGHRPTLMSASEITSLANVHLREHAAELLAQAEASGVVRNLTNSFRQKLVDLEAKSLIENPVQNGGAK